MGVSVSSARVGTYRHCAERLEGEGRRKLCFKRHRKSIAQAKHALEKKGDCKLVLAHNVSHYLEVYGGRALLELMRSVCVLKRCCHGNQSPSNGVDMVLVG